MPTCSMKYGIQGGSSPHLFAPFTPMIESGGGFVTRGFSFKGAQMSIRALRARTFFTFTLIIEIKQDESAKRKKENQLCRSHNCLVCG